MTERTNPDPDGVLHRTLALNRWVGEALIDHHRVVDKIRADIRTGALTLRDMDAFAEPIARGVADTAPDAVKTMCPLK
jgi:hypothetical protein